MLLLLTPQRSAWSRCLLRCCSCCLCCLDGHLHHLHQVGLHAPGTHSGAVGGRRLAGQGSSCRSGSGSAGSCNCFRVLGPAVIATVALPWPWPWRAATHEGKWPGPLCSGKLSCGHCRLHSVESSRVQKSVSHHFKHVKGVLRSAGRAGCWRPWAGGRRPDGDSSPSVSSPGL